MAPRLLEQAGEERAHARFIAFNVDPEFGGALDGLVAVDLRRTDASILRFCMGSAGSDAFRGHWRAAEAESRGALA